MKQGLISKEDLVGVLKAQHEMKTRGQRIFKVGELLLFQQKINLQQLQNALYQQTSRLQASRTSSEKSFLLQNQKINRRSKNPKSSGQDSIIKSFKSIFRRKKDS